MGLPLGSSFTALDEGYLSKEIFSLRAQQYDKVLKLINGYISYLQKAKQFQSGKANTSISNTLIPNTSIP